MPHGIQTGQNKSIMKKYIFTSVLTITLFAISKLFMFSTAIHSTNNFSLLEGQITLGTPLPSTLNFAGELVPIDNYDVYLKMEAALKKQNFAATKTNSMHKRAKQWFKVIDPILKRHGIPEDFRYVPFIESMFRSGTSARGADGFWQFMPETARHFGLRVDEEVDERIDVIKSTHAACRYLKALYKEFGSWTLVAAAYNIGEGKLLRTMSAQNNEDYYTLTLNKETSEYLYKIIAAKEVFTRPSDYGYTVN